MYNVHLTHSLLCFEFVEFTLNYFFILLPFFVVTLRGNDILRQILFLKRGKMTTNFYSTNQFLYEPKLLFRNLKSRDDF